MLSSNKPLYYETISWVMIIWNYLHSKIFFETFKIFLVVVAKSCKMLKLNSRLRNMQWVEPVSSPSL
jgi:hypothetical protein